MINLLSMAWVAKIDDESYTVKQQLKDLKNSLNCGRGSSLGCMSMAACTHVAFNCDPVAVNDPTVDNIIRAGGICYFGKPKIENGRILLNAITRRDYKGIPALRSEVLKCIKKSQEEYEQMRERIREQEQEGEDE